MHIIMCLYNVSVAQLQEVDPAIDYDIAKAIHTVYPSKRAMYNGYNKCENLKERLFLIYDTVEAPDEWAFHKQDPFFDSLMQAFEELKTPEDKKKEKQAQDEKWAYISIKVYESWYGKLGSKKYF